MTLAPWRSPLARALHRNRSQLESRYAQLATVRPDGKPANRTIVFRGFWGETNQLKFVTDARSEKVQHYQHSRWAELCWYFPKTREQFRILGELQLVTATEPDLTLQMARSQAWQDLSDRARAQFAWPTPAQPRATQALLTTDDVLDLTQPLVSFCLLLLDPTGVDHLELRGDPQNRWIYDRPANSPWQVQAVNP
ncbi:Npun_F5749 family FMN-dependent PPOX-type flavoprotein [Alkalinema pantanalense CENA528]|uniref:Npun_F5749 family FMN-dependent PPOX-type flavoprotein n=1 Tax=Alkalinema pantanalense TaxID=1620705 RepID=UPI003D6F5D32